MSKFYRTILMRKIKNDKAKDMIVESYIDIDTANEQIKKLY